MPYTFFYLNSIFVFLCSGSLVKLSYSYMYKMSWSWNKVNTLRKTHWKIGFDSMKRLHKLCANTWRKGILKSRCCHLLSCQIFWVLKFVQLVQCLAETSDLSMSSYIAGYQEVFKFLTLLGSGGWSFIQIQQSRRFQVPTFYQMENFESL